MPTTAAIVGFSLSCVYTVQGVRLPRRAGFTDNERMRRAFLRVYGQPPQALRRQAKQRRIRDHVVGDAAHPA